MDPTCRLCLRAHKSLLPIFSDDDQSEGLSSLISNCCSIEISTKDTLPKLICILCESKLKAVHEFKELCKESDCKLRKYYNVKAIVQAKLTYQDACVQTDALDTLSKSRSSESNKVEEVSPGIKLDETTECHSKNVAPNVYDESTTDSFNNVMRVDRTKLEHTVKTKNILKSKHWEKNNANDFRSVDLRRSDRIKKRNKYEGLHRSKVVTSKTAPLKQEEIRSSDQAVRHSSSEVLQCEIHHTPFVEQVKLDSHLHVHDKENPGSTAKQYLCDICSKTFVYKSGLYLHLKSHDSLKPYLCKFCDKSFILFCYKVRHERTHTSDKHFVCHVCSARYASSNGLKYHLRIHTGETNYHCQTCGKSFARYKYLKEHNFTHTGEKPYVCKICGFAYGNSGSLYVHEKKCKSRCDHDDVTVAKDSSETDLK